MSDDPTTVFIVTSGSYSDYGVYSAWTTYEAAKAEAGNSGQVEEWDIHTGTGEIIVFDRPDEGGRQAQCRSLYLVGGTRKSLADALAKAKAEHAENRE